MAKYLMINGSLSRGMDAARIGGCFMVVLLHAASLETYSLNEPSWAGPFYDAFSRSCVPIFLMISGALLLGKPDTLVVYLRKRLLRVVPPLLFWSLFYMAWNSWNGQSYGLPLQWLLHVVRGPVAAHLWYLYAIVGIYLFVPYLRHIWQASSSSEKNLFLLLWLLVSAWPIAQYVLGMQTDLIDTWQLGSFFGYFGYLFLGAYLRQLAEPAFAAGTTSWRGMVISAVLFVAFNMLTLVATYMYARQQSQFSLVFYDYLSPLVVGASICACYLLCWAGAAVHRLGPILKQLADCALGVYCMHVVVLDIVGDIAGLPKQGSAAWLSIPFTAILVFVISVISMLMLRRVSLWRRVT
ncbi:MAG: acyltransferase family protein [Burkholderiaceae bacterium]|nr:acyltransferase family protein [Burkholderiaceae bacterium]